MFCTQLRCPLTNLKYCYLPPINIFLEEALVLHYIIIICVYVTMVHCIISYIYISLCGWIKVLCCGIIWIYHEQLLSSPGYTPDVCILFIKTRKNKLVECFNVYGVIKGEQMNILHRNRNRLAVF